MNSFGKKTGMTGMTLIELVTVIIILGIVAVGASSFIQYGTRMYIEAQERDQLISGARFVLERLKREIRHAAPNSMKTEVISGNPCLTFYPVVDATTYIDIPVLPESAANIVTINDFAGHLSRFPSATHAVVYGLAAEDYDDGSGKKFLIQQTNGSNDLDTTGTSWQLKLEAEPSGSGNTVQFSADSPTRRMYFISAQTAFCFVGDKLTRNGVTLADKLAVNKSGTPTSSVSTASTTLQRNGLVRFVLNFENELKNEAISISSEIEVPNVP